MSGMATRLRARVTRRPSLPLTARDESDLVVIRSSPSHQRALEDLARTPSGQTQTLSESALLHAIFEAGLDAVRAAAQEAGYAELADQMATEQRDGEVDRRAEARRRRPSWADEA